MGKLTTPDWILKGGKKPTKKKEKGTFKIRKCPKCGSDEVQVVLTGEEGKGTGEWECKKCKWVGRNIVMDEVSEEEFMKYLDEKGEEVA
jgi:transcription elongation factor Elf1